MDRLGEGAVVREPDKPSAPDTANRDWTEVKKKETVEEPPEPPKEPIYKQLLELIQSMWRASGTAVEVAQDINKMTLQERMAQQVKNEPLTYSDPKVKRTGCCTFSSPCASLSSGSDPIQNSPGGIHRIRCTTPLPPVADPPPPATASTRRSAHLPNPSSPHASAHAAQP